MPTRKIRDFLVLCTDSDHTPDISRLEPGVYVHKCAACGHEEEFTIFITGIKSTTPQSTPPVYYPYPYPVPTTPAPLLPYTQPTYPYTQPIYPYITCCMGSVGNSN